MPLDRTRSGGMGGRIRTLVAGPKDRPSGARLRSGPKDPACGDYRRNDSSGPPEGSDGGGGGSGPGLERPGIREPSSLSDPGLLRDEARRNADPSGTDGGRS